MKNIFSWDEKAGSSPLLNRVAGCSALPDLADRLAGRAALPELLEAAEDMKRFIAQ